MGRSALFKVEMGESEDSLVEVREISAVLVLVSVSVSEPLLSPSSQESATAFDFGFASGLAGDLVDSCSCESVFATSVFALVLSSSAAETLRAYLLPKALRETFCGVYDVYDAASFCGVALL